LASKLLRDPDTTFEDFKALRLVCKIFDAVWSPVVLFHLSISRRHDCLFHQLRHLMQGAGPLPHFRALTLRNWGYAHPSRFALTRGYPPRRIFGIPIWSIISLVLILYLSCLLILYLSGLEKIAKLLLYLLIVVPIAYLLLVPVINLKVTVPHFASSVRRFLAKRYTTQLAQKIRFPNVYSVR